MSESKVGRPSRLCSARTKGVIWVLASDYDAALERIRTLETMLREIRHAWLKLSELTGRQYDLARLDLFNVIDATTSAALSPETPEEKP